MKTQETWEGNGCIVHSINRIQFLAVISSRFTPVARGYCHCSSQESKQSTPQSSFYTVSDNYSWVQSDLGTEHVEVAIQSWNHTQADGCLAMTFTGLVTWLFRPEVALEDAKS